MTHTIEFNGNTRNGPHIIMVRVLERNGGYETQIRYLGSWTGPGISLFGILDRTWDLWIPGLVKMKIDIGIIMCIRRWHHATIHIQSRCDAFATICTAMTHFFPRFDFQRWITSAPSSYDRVSSIGSTLKTLSEWGPLLLYFCLFLHHPISTNLELLRLYKGFQAAGYSNLASSHL